MKVPSNAARAEPDGAIPPCAKSSSSVLTAPRAPTTARSAAITRRSPCAAASSAPPSPPPTKMLRVIFRVLTTRTPYRDPETDYEAMMVKRNAPRWIAMLKKHGIDPATWSPRMPAAA